MTFINNILAFPIGSVTVQTILIALLLMLVGIVIVKLLVRFIKKAFQKSSMDSSFQGVLLTVIRVLLYTLVVLVVADALGISVTSLLTVLSIAGLAVSLAIQDTLANVFSGMILLAAKTFASGDYVQIGSLEGTVTNVDLMNTHLLTADNKTVRIPNKDVQAAAIVNYSHEPLRRVEVQVGVSYDAPTEAVKTALLKTADRAEVILDEPAPFAGLLSYQSSSITYVVRAWTASENYWTAYFALTEGLREAFAEDGIAMTFDHIIVHKE